MNWVGLKNEEQLNMLKEISHQKIQMIFKHSTQCSISAAAYQEMEKVDTTAWYLDIFQHRPISNQIAEDFGVKHESPQVLLVKNGAVVYHESHRKITQETITNALNAYE